MDCIRKHPNSHSLTLRISMALQATEAQDLPLSSLLNLVFKPHKYISAQISTYHQVHFVKNRGESTSKETLQPPKVHQKRRCHHRKYINRDAATTESTSTETLPPPKVHQKRRCHHRKYIKRDAATTESTSKVTPPSPKNCRYKQHEAYTETAGFLSDQTVTF
jgi:cell fate (sporulation/competence/biofilm development) regulator YmcA (YheA/YmcA/DUF963 family)